MENHDADIADGSFMWTLLLETVSHQSFMMLITHILWVRFHIWYYYYCVCIIITGLS